jgi:phosphate/phosphite/phosphonate ABC transporter binding protein
MTSMPPKGRIVFGITWQGREPAEMAGLTRLTDWLSERVGIRVVARVALSYSELRQMVGSGQAHIAWVPPIVYVQLEKDNAAVPLVRIERQGQSTFHAALIVRKDSPIENLDALFGASAAWVDRWSASGYVIPRAILASRKLPPELVFREERFYGSHDAAIGAVLSGRAHVAGTYASLDDDGRVIAGVWNHIPGADGCLRALMTFGSIPGDVIAARLDLDPGLREALTAAFVAACEDPEIAPIARAIFGAESFREGPLDSESYDLLRAAIEH